MRINKRTFSTNSKLSIFALWPFYINSNQKPQIENKLAQTQIQRGLNNMFLDFISRSGLTYIVRFSLKLPLHVDAHGRPAGIHRSMARGVLTTRPVHRWHERGDR